MAPTIPGTRVQQTSTIAEDLAAIDAAQAAVDARLEAQQQKLGEQRAAIDALMAEYAGAE